jgi:hypothetical protein
MRTLLFVAVLGSAGCLRTTEFKCTESAQCGTDGVCEEIGFCSFGDTRCESGRRFGELSGATYSGRCVGDGSIDGDAGIDTPGDGTPGSCPGTYAAVAGVADRQYRVVAAAADWQSQKGACAADGANTYLAIPDSQAELTAILTAAAQARIWVGATDQPTDDEMFVTVNNAPFVSTLWDTASNEPDGSGFPASGGGAADCVAAEQSTGKISDEKCQQAYPAVCECQP